MQHHLVTMQQDVKLFLDSSVVVRGRNEFNGHNELVCGWCVLPSLLDVVKPERSVTKQEPLAARDLRKTDFILHVDSQN